MPYNADLDSEEDRTESIDTIHFGEYKTRDHYVFSVYRGSEHWKMLSNRTGRKKAIWLKCHGGKPHVPAKQSDLPWLNDVFESSGQYSRVERFPRTAGVFAWGNLPRFNPSTVDEFKWQIYGFLAQGSIQLVFGERGSFKSTLLLLAAKSVAGRESFLGMKTKRRRVLILDYENPPDVIKTRCADLGLELPDNPWLVIWDRFGPRPLPKPDDPGLEKFVRDCVAETGHGPWIIFDSWASLLRPGEGGEFTGQIAPVYQALRKLADLGATITVLDHSRKHDKKMLYGGQDKEAKADSIHNLTVFPNKIAPTNPIVRVDSWHKRAAPKGIGSFAFEVQSTQDRHGKWRIAGLVSARDPEKAKSREDINLLRGLIKQNPTLGQEALARKASEEGLPRDQAIRLLKEGIGKDWQIRRIGHNKFCFSLI